MRIIHCEDLFFPESGYQLNILSKYMAAAGHEIIIVTSELHKVPSYLRDFFGNDNIKQKDEAFTARTGVKIIRIPIITYYSGRSIYYPGYFKLLDSLKPDVVYVHGEDTYIGIRFILRYKRFYYPILFDDHMVEMASVNPLYPVFRKGYRIFIAPKIKKHDLTVIRTVNDDFIFKHYGIPRNQGPYVGFGSDLMTFHPDEDARKTARRELNIADDCFVFIYAGKLDESKGGGLLAEAVYKQFSCSKKIVFLIIGKLIGSSQEYVNHVQNLLDTSENRLIILPTQPYVNLAKYYQCADVALFPKQCSLSYFDVQACGLPVVSEDNPVNVDRVQHNNGFVFKSGDVSDFRQKMIDMVNMPITELRKMGDSARKHIEENYNYSTITDQYMDIVNKVVERYHDNKRG